MTSNSAPQQVGKYARIHRDQHIAYVEFDRGDGKNALNLDLMNDLTQAAELLREDIESSVVILAGKRAFSAGADLKASQQLLSKDSEMSLLEKRQTLKSGPDMCAAWENLEQITIAAIENFCIGGGLALAIACDHRIASSDAVFQLPEVPLGMNMSWQSNPRLTALIGPSRAKRFAILGDKLDAQTALKWGLIDEHVPGDTLSTAQALARRYAELPPIPLRMTKQAINAAAGALGHATSYMDRDQFLLTSLSEDLQEGVGAFLEKRKPAFKGD